MKNRLAQENYRLQKTPQEVDSALQISETRQYMSVLALQSKASLNQS